MIRTDEPRVFRLGQTFVDGDGLGQHLRRSRGGSPSSLSGWEPPVDRRDAEEVVHGYP